MFENASKLDAHGSVNERYTTTDFAGDRVVRAVGTTARFAIGRFVVASVLPRYAMSQTESRTNLKLEIV